MPYYLVAVRIIFSTNAFGPTDAQEKVGDQVRAIRDKLRRGESPYAGTDVDSYEVDVPVDSDQESYAKLREQEYSRGKKRRTSHAMRE